MKFENQKKKAYNNLYLHMQKIEKSIEDTQEHKVTNTLNLPTLGQRARGEVCVPVSRSGVFRKPPFDIVVVVAQIPSHSFSDPEITQNFKRKEKRITQETHRQEGPATLVVYENRPKHADTLPADTKTYTKDYYLKHKPKE